MIDTKDDQEIDSSYEEWWDEAVHHTRRKQWKPAVQDYLTYEYLKASHEKFSFELVKRIISHVGKYDERWRMFPKSSFKPGQYKAHKQL